MCDYSTEQKSRGDSLAVAIGAVSSTFSKLIGEKKARHFKSCYFCTLIYSKPVKLCSISITLDAAVFQTCRS